MTDASNLTRIISEVEPDEVYNLGAQSHVAVSFETPEYTANVDALGAFCLLEAIRFLGLEKDKVLSSFFIGTLWISSRNSSKRNYSFLSKIPLRCF